MNQSNDLNANVLEQLAQLRKENEALKAKEAKRTTITLKVSEKGACSLYGMGRFPITMYSQQWSRIFAAQEEIKAFLEANKSKLTVKE
jgi:hypothetical protein